MVFAYSKSFHSFGLVLLTLTAATVGVVFLLVTLGYALVTVEVTVILP